jgi:hypothetical protein
MPGTRQTRHPPTGIGLGVDRTGGPVIDPTENVLALVDVQKQHQREKDELDRRYQDAMREAETRRINELAAQKQTFDLELAKVLRANQDAASTLLATQLKEVKNDLSDRTAKLEQFRWETGGKTSVTDPATAEALAKITLTLQSLTLSGKRSEGQGIGQREVIAYGIAAATILISLFWKH